MASFIDPQPRNAIRLLIAPSLQFAAADADWFIHSKLTCCLKFTHNLGPYIGKYLIEGASDAASMGMFAWHRRACSGLPIFPQQAAGAFAL
jgi:hypothetical protein